MNVKIIMEFIDKYSDHPKIKILLCCILSGASYGLALFIINVAMMHVSAGNDTLKTTFLVLFVVFCLLHTWFKKYFMTGGVKLTENVIRNVRQDIIDKIRRSELGRIERMGKGRLYTCLTEDTEAISQTAPMLIIAMESMFSLLGVLIYIIFLSFQAFIFIMIIFLLMFLVHSRANASASEKLELSKDAESEFFDGLNDVLFGFKEIRINYKKKKELLADIASASGKTAALKTGADIGFDNSFVLLASVYFIMLIGAIFIFPVFGNADKSTIVRLVSSLLFLWGPMAMVFLATRAYTVLLASIGNIHGIDAGFGKFDSSRQDKEPDPPTDFEEIRLDSIEFSYKGGKGELLFRMGPIDFFFKKGEIIFITGGNGCGKSTLMKLLTGLYYPEPGGSITMGNRRITAETYPSYRELFSTIFTDFHIFEKLYGLDDVDDEKVNDLLRQMNIDHKTMFREGKFTNIDLSTGQRKRIAYVASLLEDKQIYVFDEWAADQDPVFRKNFYNEFLNDMRAVGKTVIAVSHDDRYFEAADRIIKMEEGKIVIA